MEWNDERAFWTLVLVIIAAFAYRYMPRWRSRSPFLAPREVKRRLEADPDAVVLDVRTPSEFAGRGGHIPGAVNVPLSELDTRLSTRDGELGALKEVQLYVCCSAETRAARAARLLRDRGFHAVTVVQGGLRGWRRSTLTVETETGGGSAAAHEPR